MIYSLYNALNGDSLISGNVAIFYMFPLGSTLNWIIFTKTYCAAPLCEP